MKRIRAGMRGKQESLEALEEIRNGVLSGKRLELPSARMQLLSDVDEPLVGEVSYDVRHRPLSDNVTQHFSTLWTLAPDSMVRFSAFMPLKRGPSSSAASKTQPSTLLVVVDNMSSLSLHTIEGDVLLDSFDLGHGPGATITQLALSPNQENHFVATADDRGKVRVHSLRIFYRKITMVRNETDKESAESGEDDTGVGSARMPKQRTVSVTQKLVVSSNFSTEFELPLTPSGEARKINALMPIDRGVQTYFVTGDATGVISVYHRNGTMRGRVLITDDPGGVMGFVHAQGQNLIYFSSHSFGYFSVSQLDVQYTPCTGWGAPLFDLVVDSNAQQSRAILALADGDILVFATTRGKSKACDLSNKFPRVSNLPMRLHLLRGHVLALPVLPESHSTVGHEPPVLPESHSTVGHEPLRELFFFNLAPLETGFSVTPSRLVTLQLSFAPRRPEAFALAPPGAVAGNSGGQKLQIALRFAGVPGVDLFDFSLKMPVTRKRDDSSDMASDDSEGEELDDADLWVDDEEKTRTWWGWFESLNESFTWLPKVGVFGVAIVGVVIWNVRKARSGEFDDDFFKEQLKDIHKKVKREAEKEAAKKATASADRPAEAGLGIDYDDD